MTYLNLLAIFCPVQPRHHSSPLSQGCTAGLFHLGVYQDLHVFSAKLLSSCLWLFVPSQLQDFALPHVEFHDIPVCPTVWNHEVQPFGVSATPHSFASTANLLRVHPAPFSRSLMKILNRIGPSIDSWDTLLVTGLQLDFVPLIIGCSTSFQLNHINLSLVKHYFLLVNPCWLLFMTFLPFICLDISTKLSLQTPFQEVNAVGILMYTRYL